jgi:hypothetical protein
MDGAPFGRDCLLLYLAFSSRRVLTKLGRCEIFGRCAPTFRSLGFAYGSIAKSSAKIPDLQWQRKADNRPDAYQAHALTS